MENQTSVPILFPIEPEEFWKRIRNIIREEIKSVEKKHSTNGNVEYKTPGLIYKPLYKMAELCSVFQVSRPTIYDWIKNGKLKPYKIQSRVYFLWDDVQKLITQPNDSGK